jgi:hypothetical protein
MVQDVEVVGNAANIQTARAVPIIFERHSPSTNTLDEIVHLYSYILVPRLVNGHKFLNSRRLMS